MFPVFLIQILVAAIIVGLLLYILSILPIDATVKRIIQVIVIVILAIWLIYILLGLMPAITPLRR